MKTAIDWLKGIISGKGLVLTMSCYKLGTKAIMATDGNIIASYPWPYVGPETLIPSKELEQILSVITEEPKFTHEQNRIKIQSGTFKANLPLFSADQWGYPGINEKSWQPIPPTLLEAMIILRPFLSLNAMQPWATCIYLKGEFAYATNNIICIGYSCKGLHLGHDETILIPLGAIDFILKHLDTRVIGWQHEENYLALKWESGAWMRTQLVSRKFPKTGTELVHEAWDSNPTQKITPEFRSITERFSTFGESSIKIYKDKVVIEQPLQGAIIEESSRCEISSQKDHTIWAVEQLRLMTQVATHWQPSDWPKPCYFKGEKIAGVIAGRMS